MTFYYCGAFRFPKYDAAAARVLNNAHILQELGHTVKFISWGGKYDEKDLCADGIYRVDGMEYCITNEIDAKGGLFNKMMQVFTRGKKTLELLNEATCKPDVIIMYNADFFWTRTMINYCKKNDIKLINDITEWYDSNELHIYERPFNILNMKFLQKKVRNKIVISSFLKDFYQDSNNILLPPLCNQKDEKWNKTIENELIKPFNGITLIYAGTPAKKDLVHVAINVVNRLANEHYDIRFLILGITKEMYLNRYSSQLDSSELHNNIIFLGRVSQELVPAYYKKADFMILLRESTRKNNAGFPTKVAESISAGVPVITNESSDLPLYIESGKNGFLLKDISTLAIYDFFKNKLLCLQREDINTMKRCVQDSKKVFDFHTYKDAMSSFLSKLDDKNNC